MSEYDDRLREQQAQYATGADIHALPGIFHHWSHRFLAPALRQVFGQASITHVYSSAFAKTLTNGKLRKFVSIGSGDCSQEIEIAKELRAAGHEDFEIIGLEVAENLIAEARAAIQREGLSKQITTRFFDINRDVVDGPVDGFMAHHSLHHIVELERLFDMINAVLVPEGCFATCDMIGRNGHMRWPEALRYVEAAWANLPEAKKFNWQHRERHDHFVNWDCSKEGFEGVRAQDILPLLVQRFDFQAFAACGGFIDPFIDRGYGPNYSRENPMDCAFIDLLATANDAMLASGEIKPTMMFAHMVKKSHATGRPRVVGNLTPEFCVRAV
jgi:SAM-dependent methyltransferase